LEFGASLDLKTVSGAGPAVVVDGVLVTGGRSRLRPVEASILLFVEGGTVPGGDSRGIAGVRASVIAPPALLLGYDRSP
jgi:hypothetical protein